MSPDEQEALSWQHARGCWCVPLSSGRIAVWLHPNGRLHAIVDSWNDIIQMEPRPHRPIQLHLPLIELEKEIDL
jgi:hypothetical protein